MEFARLVAVVAFVTVFVRCSRCLAVLDIILWSNGSSAASGRSVKGLSIDIVNGSNSSLEAVARKNVTELVTFRFDWYKDGSLVNAALWFRRAFIERNTTNGGVDNASFILPISEVRGNKSGNYSIKLRINSIFEAEAYVMVTVGDAQRPKFTVFPQHAINCSSGNRSTPLTYVAVGFPRPVYTLRCSGVQYTSEPSTSGAFLIPPEVCCLGSKCLALAYNGYSNPIESPPTIVRDPLPSDSCQQHTACLSPGLEMFLRSCSSTANDGSVNGQTVNVAADDPHAVLEVVAYQKSSATTQLLLTWYKDGRTVNASDGIPPEPCEGSDEWGSWMRCGYRLQLSEFKDNMSGNYSVELRQANIPDVLAAAWLMVAVGTPGPYNCTIIDVAQPNLHDGWSRYPATCNALCPPTIILSHVIASGTTSGVVMLAVVLTTVLCCRARKARRLAIVKRCSVSSLSKSVPSNTSADLCSKQEPISIPYFNSAYDKEIPQACNDGSGLDKGSNELLLREQMPTYPHYPYKFTVNGLQDCLETDGVSSSLATESSFLRESTSQNNVLNNCNLHGLQSPTGLSVVVDSTGANSFSCVHRSPTFVIISAANVQVGCHNTMLINSNSDSAFDTLVDPEYCTASQAFEDCHCLNDETGIKLPMNDHVPDEPCSAPAQCASFHLPAQDYAEDRSAHELVADLPAHDCYADLHHRDCPADLPPSGCSADLPPHDYPADLSFHGWPADISFHDRPADKPVLDCTADLPSYYCAATQPADSADLVLGVPNQSPHDWLSLPCAV